MTIRFRGPHGHSAAARDVEFRSRYGPWAVVTGASSGIGRALARALARRGLDVVLVARRGEALDDLAATLADVHGVATRTVTADLTRGVGPVLTATEDLDVGLLVAAAGFGTSGRFVDGALDTERAMLAVNCAAVLDLTWHCARQLSARGRGGIVLLSSIVAYQGMAQAAHYAATKAWVHTLAEGLHRELAPAGVDVLAAAPGPVGSEFADRAGMRLGATLAPERIADPILDALAARRAVVLPGALSLLLRATVAPLPRRLRTQIMGRIGASMTRHRRDGVAAVRAGGGPGPGPRPGPRSAAAPHP